QPRRKEIWFHNVEGHLYITGTPGRRDWYANLLAHPEFTFHLKQSVRADLPARATAILDKARRREIIAAIHQKLGGNRDLEAWAEGSPIQAGVFLYYEERRCRQLITGVPTSRTSSPLG